MTTRKKVKAKTPQEIFQEFLTREMEDETTLRMHIENRFHAYLTSCLGLTPTGCLTKETYRIYRDKAEEVAKSLMDSMQIEEMVQKDWHRWEANIRRHFRKMMEQCIESQLRRRTSDILDGRVRQLLDEEIAKFFNPPTTEEEEP